MLQFSAIPLSPILPVMRIHRSASTIHSKVSAWLDDGLLPDSQKHAIVSPLPKKPGLNVVDITNYRPVSNLTFVSKVIEQAVASQLYEYLVANDLLPRYQSAYRTEAFNRNRHATCLVEHTDSRPQTPAHSAWHS